MITVPLVLVTTPQLHSTDLCQCWGEGGNDSLIITGATSNSSLLGGDGLIPLPSMATSLPHVPRALPSSPSAQTSVVPSLAKETTLSFKVFLQVLIVGGSGMTASSSPRNFWQHY